ncbi:MAG: 50S ribosomal protein L9 [bacterium]|nr:50S ribosomal protein L9 [bacterium]
MKVLLNTNIENLGRLGDLVEVKPGYARNYLLPKGMAVKPNKHNLEVMKFKKVKAEKELELEKVSAIEQKKKLEEITLTIEKKAGETDTLFGSVTAMEIESLLAEKGFIIECKKFHMDEHIKKLGTYECKIKLVEDIEAVIKIEVIKEGGEEEAAEETEAAEEAEVAEEVAPAEEETEE